MRRCLQDRIPFFFSLILLTFGLEVVGGAILVDPIFFPGAGILYSMSPFSESHCVCASEGYLYRSLTEARYSVVSVAYWLRFSFLFHRTPFCPGLRRMPVFASARANE